MATQQVVPFESAPMPAFMAQAAAIAEVNQEITSGGLAFPRISIKGKVFHLRRGDENNLITKPDADDEPAAAIEVVIIRGNTRDSKNYYEHGFEEGSTDKPTCSSDDGISPNADVAEPQATKCNGCPHNAWGSRVSEQGSKGKACADFRRLAIATPDAINDPMLINVPAASLKAMTQYGDLLKKRGAPMFAVVTKIGFDYSVAHPALTFKAVGYVTEKQFNEVQEMRDSDLVTRIIGLSNTGTAALAAPPKFVEEATDPAPAKPAAAKVQPKPTPKKVEPKAPPPEEPAPKAEAKVAPKKEPVVVDGADDLDAAVAALLEDDDD